MHVDVDEFAEFTDQVLDMNTGPSIDIRREFTGQDRGMHERNLSSPPGLRCLNPALRRRPGHGLPMIRIHWADRVVPTRESSACPLGSAPWPSPRSSGSF